MALDGLFLNKIKGELDFLVGGRVDKIAQPSREEIIVSMRSHGKNVKLLFSAEASSARVHLTKQAIENPKTPPMFCMLLRKHLGNGKLLSIRQDGLERILYFDFEAMNEIGDIVKNTLAIEIMGRCSNIILINSENKIVDSIKRVDTQMSRERMVLPGMKYSYPPRDNRQDFRTITYDTLKSEMLKLPENLNLAKALIRIFEGISPIIAREWIFSARIPDNTIISTADENTFLQLFREIEKTAYSLKLNQNVYTILYDLEGFLKDFSFMEILQYGNLMEYKNINSASETLDYFYFKRDEFSRMKQRSADLYKLLLNLTERISKRTEIQKQELLETLKRDEIKLCGDLISANIYRLEKGMDSFTTENFYNENCPEITIKLDKKLSPSKNMQRYFEDYRKACTAEKILAKQIEKGEAELKYIDSVYDALTRTNSEDEVTELRLELLAEGYIKSSKLKTKPPKTKPPLEFNSPDNFRILIGRNNVQNDYLTMKFAEKSDIWLHTKNITGSHVIIVTNGEEVPDSTILYAARLAAFHSKAKNSSQVPVDYVEARYVKKPNGSKPGMVIFTNNKTIYVTPLSPEETL